MRHILAICALITLTACGSSTPTAPTQTTPPPPPPPPPVVYPTMTGNWGGTLTIVVSLAGTNASNTCSHTWTITNQSQGSFSGTFQLAGGTIVNCAQAGTVSGTVGTDGRLTGVAFSIAVGSSGCVRTSGDGLFNGQLANGIISATENEQEVCSGVAATRNLTITLSH
jgi:hypothetical protein